MLLPQAVTAAAAVTFSGRLFDRIGPRVLVIFGLAVLATTSLYFTQITTTSDFFTIEVLLALRGLALACTVQPSVTTALNVVARRDLPRGSSLVNASRQVMQALGIAILSTILSTQMASYFSQAGSQHLRPDPNMAFIQGFNAAFTFVFVVALAGVIFGFFMPGKPGEWPIKWQAATREERKPVEAGAVPEVARRQ
jgi:MFS family permease